MDLNLNTRFTGVKWSETTLKLNREVPPAGKSLNGDQTEERRDNKYVHRYSWNL